MLAIGRGLMARPRLLMLDEPSLGLAPLLVPSFLTVFGVFMPSKWPFAVEQNVHQALTSPIALVLENGPHNAYRHGGRTPGR